MKGEKMKAAFLKLLKEKAKSGELFVDIADTAKSEEKIKPTNIQLDGNCLTIDFDVYCDQTGLVWTQKKHKPQDSEYVATTRLSLVIEF